jgi:hypothetical protein
LNADPTGSGSETLAKAYGIVNTAEPKFGVSLTWQSQNSAVLLALTHRSDPAVSFNTAESKKSDAESKKYKSPQKLSGIIDHAEQDFKVSLKTPIQNQWCR